jgi:hypothetical protein
MSTIHLRVLSDSVEKSVKEKKVSKKRSLFCFFAKPKRSFACFCTLFCRDDHGERWWLLVVVVGGVDIAVADNGVLTLGEWLFACVARSFIRTLVPSFVRSFLCSFIRLFVLLLLLLLVVVLILLSTTMEY